MSLSVAFDTERAVLVTGGALCAPGANLECMFEFKAEHMRPGQQVIPLVALLAVVSFVAYIAGGAVVSPSVIAMLYPPERQDVVLGELAALAFVADYASLCNMFKIMACNTGGHTGSIFCTG